uniref:cobyrinate a,c-diamide synthase n=1 Tax=Candidatus Tripitaka californicus TaxID=3367616 RepID=UPI00402946D3
MPTDSLPPQVYPSLLIAGTHSGVGKTTITLALMTTLKKKGLKVQGFKVGPDYIDPSHHTTATGIPSRNLDTWMMGPEACLELFTRAAREADISVIEGVMGLYDGHSDGTGAGSTAHLAKLLGVPVILVLDAKGIGQSAAAMALGYKLLDPEVLLAGVILNNVASKTHLEYLKKPIEGQAGLPVLAYMERDTDLSIPERHLGLTPSQEFSENHNLYEDLAERLIWLGKRGPQEVASLTREIPPQRPRVFDVGVTRRVAPTMRLALARDEAFHFYYQDNLDLLQSLGAQLLPFSPLRDSTLPPEVDLIYIGGGFPELYASQLEANLPMREAMRQAAEKGVAIYAECGGLMYLMERLINFEGRSYDMCGIFSGASQMGKKRQALGYVTVRAREDNLLCKRGETLRGHVFHWSRLVDVPEDSQKFAYELEKGMEGVPANLGRDGLQKDNVLASYVHVHFAQNLALATNLLSSAKKVKA